jgi:hypothetical protein
VGLVGPMFHFWCPVPVKVRTNIQTYRRETGASERVLSEAKEQDNSLTRTGIDEDSLLWA